MKPAYYYSGTKHGKKVAWLIIYAEVSADAACIEVAVSGKVEARKVAAEHGAKPWNF